MEVVEKYKRVHLEEVVFFNDYYTFIIFKDKKLDPLTELKLIDLLKDITIEKEQEFNFTLEDKLIYSCFLTFALKKIKYFSLIDLYILINGNKRTNAISLTDLEYIKERLNLMFNTYISVKSTKGNDTRVNTDRLLDITECEYLNPKNNKKECVYKINSIFCYNILKILKQTSHLATIDSELLTIKKPNTRLRSLNYYLLLTLYNMKNGRIDTDKLTYKTIFNNVNLDYETMTKKQREHSRECIKTRLELFKKENFIKSYEMGRDGVSYVFENEKAK